MSEIAKTMGKLSKSAVVRVKPLEFNQTDEARTRYWVGVKGSAFSYCTAGGITFPSYSSRRHENGVVTNVGGRVALTEEEVERVRTAVAAKVVVTEGGRKTIRDTRGPRGYRPHKGDEPLGKFLFMISLDESLSEDMRDNPPCMIEE